MTEYIGRLYYFLSRKQVASKEMLQEYYQNIHLVNKPIELKGDNKSCVLLIHGWSSTSYEMRHLSQKLNSEGFSVCAPLLPGHGTNPSDLEGVTWEDWYKFIEDEYLKLKKKYKKVYVGGCSLGGNLSILLAQKYECVSGLVLLGTPFRMKKEGLGSVVVKFISYFKKYLKKTYPLWLKKKCGIISLISYQEYPVKSTLEVLKAIRKSRQDLHQIKQPTLILQSNSDFVINQNSIHHFYDKLGSRNKVSKLVPNAYHNFISNKNYSFVYDDIIDFFKKH